jgi:hypothetical protein
MQASMLQSEWSVPEEKFHSPESKMPPAAGHAAALRESDAGRDAHVGIGTPDFLLRPRIPPGHTAVMRRKIVDHPACGHVAARQHLRDVEVRDERQLHASPHFGLEVAQQPGAVERVHRRRRESAELFGLGRLLAQERNKLAGALHRFVVAHAGKVRGRLLHVHSIVSSDAPGDRVQFETYYNPPAPGDRTRGRTGTVRSRDQRYVLYNVIRKSAKR